MVCGRFCHWSKLVFCFLKALRYFSLSRQGALLRSTGGHRPSDVQERVAGYSFIRARSSVVGSIDSVLSVRCVVCGCRLTDDNRSARALNVCRECLHSLEF